MIYQIKSVHPSGCHWYDVSKEDYDEKQTGEKRIVVIKNFFPQEQRKQWPFVLAPSIVANLVHEALMDFDGDMIAALRNVFIEQGLTLRSESPE